MKKRVTGHHVPSIKRCVPYKQSQKISKTDRGGHQGETARVGQGDVTEIKEENKSRNEVHLLY